MELRGGDTALRGSQVLTLRDVAGAPVQRKWDVFLGEGENQTKLAQLEIDSAGSLVFRWETAADVKSAAHLGNCALVLSTFGAPTHVLALRQAVRSEPLVVDLAASRPRAPMGINALPDLASTFLEIVTVAGTSFEPKSSSVISARGGEAQLTLEDSGNLLVLKLSCTERHDGLTLNVTPQLQFPSLIYLYNKGVRPLDVNLNLLTSEPPALEPFVLKKLGEVTNTAAGFKPRFDLLKKNLSNQKMPPAQRDELHERLVQQERECQDYVLRLNQLQAFLDARKNTIEFQVRVYHKIDGAEIDLFVTNGSPDQTP
jgi:hypothetical protein